MNFEPNLKAHIDFRIRDLELDLHEYEKTLVRFHSGIHHPQKNKGENDRLWDHYELKKHVLHDGTTTAALRFYQDSDLEYQIKEKCFEIFFKHFPDGIQGSLIGYPQQTL